MADNTTLNAGTGGDIIATDDIAGVKHQRVKVEFGADGTATDVSAAAPLPIADYDPEMGIAAGMTTYRERVIAQRYTVLADSIADGLAAFWTSTVANGGTNTVTGGEGLLQTSATANGSAQLVSTAPAYYPGQSAWLIGAMRFGDTGIVGNTRRVGAFTVSGIVPQDGYYFELVDTTLNAVTCKGGVATAVASTAWSRAAAAPFTLDTNYRLFEIRWTGNRADFFIDNVLRHTVSVQAAPITNTLNFPMAIQSINTTNATNRVLAVRNIGLGRFGSPDVTAVTGTFFQATQPVSIASMPSTPVTGTFWQATQPVSGAFFQATQPVSLATNTPTLAASTASIGTVQQAALTKGTQGTTGVTSQDLKDAGRNLITHYTALPALTTAADALVTLNGWKSGAAVAGVTGTAGVTTGKTLRIESVTINYLSVATGGGARVSLRAVSTGTAAVGSPVVQSWFVGGPTSATAGLWANLSIPLPDGMEFPAGTSFAVTIVGIGATGVAAAAGYVTASFSAYEY